MIIYQKTRINFHKDVFTNNIANIIHDAIYKNTNKRIGEAELLSFSNSLPFMDRILHDDEIPEDCMISIEFHIPQTSKRIDFIISGSDGQYDTAIIIELKQWQKAELTTKDGIVKTRFKHGIEETSHPAYQAWSYAALLQGFNQTIHEENIVLKPCAYLHNYLDDNVISNDFYKDYIEKAPVFFKQDALKLRNFIKQFIKKGDHNNTLYRIDNGKIKPTKSLADALTKMMSGNKEFLMIDEQKVIYENAKELALKSKENNKNVFIVEGGPGTGKSVVAINLLVELIQQGVLAQYVTKTSAPRDVYFSKLVGQKKRAELKNLFVGSGTFINASENQFQALIIDEAHRLTKHTGFLKQGKNQIEEIIDASLFSVFFLDEDQRVHIDDYGDIETITSIARSKGALIQKAILTSQFRCNGSDGYLAWVDNVLQIRETANTDLADIDFDFKVLDTPIELREIIVEKNKINNKARMVAGYCWPWSSKKDSKAFDIIFPKFDFQAKWNMTEYGGTWIIDPNSVSEIGCIHTAQGLEVDYIGVIIGDDLIVRDGDVLVDPKKRDKDDRTIFGYKKLIREQPIEGKELIRKIIKNTYRTLMTRGMKGCYIYCTDKETSEYFKQNINSKS